MPDKIVTFTRRLKIIKGQIDGIVRLMESEDQDCIKILTQMKAVKNSFQSLSSEVVKESLSECSKRGKNGDPKLQKEIINMFTKF